MKRRFKVLSLLLIVSILFTSLPSNVFASALKIVAIKDITTSVYLNQSYSMPKTVDATMSNKTTQKVAVTWNPKTVVTSKTGNFVYKGTVKGFAKQVSLKLKVLPLDDEVQRAISYGLVPKEVQGDYNKTITFSQYSQLLTNLITIWDDSKLTKWKSTIAKASKSDEIMHREDGILAASYAVVVMGANAFTNLYGERTQIPQNEIDKQMKDLSWNYPYFTGWDKIVYPTTNCNYMWGGVQFFMNIISKVSLKAIYPYDLTKQSMHLQDQLTRMEAIQSVVRLYEAVRNEVFIPAAKVKPCTISQATIMLANDMPDASCESIPKWYGCTMDNKSANWGDDGGVGIMYWESDVRYYAEQGFTFLRIPLDVRMLFKNGDPSEVNEANLKDIEDLISWGAKYGVHICLDFHNVDGFTTDAVDSNDTMFENPEQQEKFVKCWAYLAERYRNIPNNVLSFDLLNEPHGDNLTEETYSSVMLKAIKAIRKYTPDRLIFADMMNGTRYPVYGLVDSGVAQSVHLYDHSIKELSKYTVDIDSGDWNVYFINGIIHTNNGSFTIHGNFKAGTKITVSINMFHAQGKAVLAADGAVISSIALGAEQVGDGGCIGISEEGTDGECRSYNDTSFTVTLKKDASKLEIYPAEGSKWMMLQGISIMAADSGILLWRNDIITNETTPILTVVGGVVSADNSATLLTKNDNFYIELMRGIKAFSDETGIQVMVQETGIEANNDHNLTMMALDRMLSAFDDCGFGWCLWSRNLSFLAVTESDKRVLATYRKVGENRWADIEMLALLKTYMSE